jgi:putative DNA primase/helicase
MAGNHDRNDRIGEALNLRDIARALGGDVIGRQVLAPGPGHSSRDRSLAVRLSRSGPDGLLVFSHCGDDWRLCQEHVGKRLGLARCRPDRAGRVAHPVSVRLTIPASSTGRDNDADGAARTRHALAIWSETADPRATPVWRYLAARGIALGELPPAIYAVLRWHPHCPWGTGGARHGCMVALWTDAVTGEPRAIHRTAITDAGAKVGRKTLGPNAGCLIRLWPDEVVERGLVIGEGIETTLAATTRIQHRGTLLTPAWAAGDAGHLAGNRESTSQATKFSPHGHDGIGLTSCPMSVVVFATLDVLRPTVVQSPTANPIVAALAMDPVTKHYRS